jgi:hypothetical protein
MLVAGLVVLALIAGGVVVLTKGGNKGTSTLPTSPTVSITTTAPTVTPTTVTPTTVTPTPTTVPPDVFPNLQETQLLNHVPKAFRDLCIRLEDDTVPASALAAVDCLHFNGADEAHYISFPSASSMASYYEDRVSRSPVFYSFDHRADCLNLYDEEGKYPPKGTVQGRVLCYITVGNSRPIFEWTDNGCFVYAWATRIQDKDAVELTSWWSDVKKSGPIGC